MPTTMVHAGWGDPARRKGLPSGAVSWLTSRVGRGTPSVPAPLADLPPSRLDADQLAALRSTGADVDLSDEARVSRAAGRSYLDLLSLRTGAFPVPDAVVRPTADQVGAVLRAGVSVVPFGGGTSVVGGVAPLGSPVVALDLCRLDRLVSLSEQDRTAVLEPGLTGPAAEALLNARGWTLGHFPQSFELATIGGFAATRSAGQASTGYGRFDALVVAMTVETPAGPLSLGGPPSAAGPSLLQLFLGSEGAFGVITSVTVRIKPLPAVRRYDAWLVRSWEDGIRQLRELEQSGVVPEVARLSDVDETATSLRLSAPRAVRMIGRGRCLLVLGWEGSPASVRRRRVRMRGIPLPGAGEKWEHGRYDGPYLRDDLMDAGFLVETLETSASWSSLLPVWTAVRTALTEALGECVVMCHVSHLYPHGASLYFTVLASADREWPPAKKAATDALVATGATITHHHAVGTDHAPWMSAEVGSLGVEVLRAVKQVVDPSGVLNPGKLIP
ncbi:MAG: Alkyldihydroxyacetonephosphate synthase [Frankiales bacterium]|nr:Alkyldihydroxyacetonephosphate synthase [Frankiales bacterium]